MWVKEEIEKRANFDNIIFVQASAAISSNCGPGSFGILYLEKTEKDYNLGVFVDKKMSILEDGAEADQASEEQEEEVYDIIDYKGNYMLSDTTEHKWYDDLKGIDGETAIEYSGSEESFRLVLKIFYDSIDDKARELNSYFENEDWKNYIIKVHAIKSSAKLMGAIKTSEEARLLEDAGKAGNIDFIRGNHGAFISGYTGFKAILAPLFEEESKEKASEDNKPKADKYLMEGVYEGLLEAAKAMNCDAIEEILKEIGDYTIPDDERERLDALREMAGKFDYDSIVTELTRG
jgi:HPt (histidine-containing phosphotransfer) domain-containing protein